MKKIKMILTVCGCPGASTFIRYLKKVKERDIEIIGFDMNPEAIGRFMCDKFYVVPAADSEDYIPKVLEIVEKEKPDIFFPASSYDVMVTSKNKDKIEALGAKVMVSSVESLDIANNKYKMYEALKDKDVPIPKYYYPKDLDEFIECAKKLGYPEKQVCFKPHVSKGSRGFRIIDDSISRKDLLLNYKPTSTYISMNEFIEIFKDEEEFPDFILMKVVTGKDYDVMCIANNNEALLTTIKTRENNRGGVITEGELIKKPELVKICNEIFSAIPLKYNISIQFIGDKLIEINPRTSTYIYQEDMIEPYLAIKLALGEYIPDDVKKFEKKINYGRRMIRYFDQIFYQKE